LVVTKGSWVRISGNALVSLVWPKIVAALFPRREMFSDVDWIALISWFTLTFGIGHIVSNTMISGQYSNIFREIGLYPIQPPSIIFSAIWIPIYICNSVSVFLVWQTKAANTEVAVWELSLAFYVIQNFLASFWSSLIFNYRNIKISVAVIAFAFIFTTCNVVFFFMQHDVAGALLTLYWIWMLGLMYFTIGIAMNRKAPPLTGAFMQRTAGTPSSNNNSPDQGFVAAAASYSSPTGDGPPFTAARVSSSGVGPVV
jgi:tryptophan-rich sensory protein